jgi:hypothetical protein
MFMPGNESILGPVAAMVSLTCVVWVAMYVQRIVEMSRRNVDAQQLASREAVMALLKDTRAADNFRNLCELPVLFYFAALLALVTSQTDGVLLTLAWIFVAFRVLHSLIHCTYNRVMHRFAAYLVSACTLWAMWAWLIIGWWS